MGHSSRKTSTAGQSSYQQARKELTEIVQDKNAQKAADYGTQVLLASQPNGPAKLPIYSGAKQGAKFALRAQEDGFETAAKEFGMDMVKSQAASEVSSAVVDSASREITKRGADEANKAMSESSERALEQSLGIMMQEGGEAL